MESALHDTGLAAFVCSILAVPLGLVTLLDEMRWGRNLAERRRQRDVRSRLVSTHYKARPGKPLYSLVPDMRLEVRVKGRRTRFAMRGERLRDFTEPERLAAESIARQWIGSVGAFALAAGSLERLPLRHFLATFHLGVLREGVVAVPVAARLLSAGSLSVAERENLYWGMALLDLAARYNSVARQQRSAVYFEAIGHQPPVGPVRNPPLMALRPFLSLVDIASPHFRLRRWRYVRCRWWLTSLALQIAPNSTPRPAPR